jgi:F0F1-type ATP synthase membrane subunit c/vacuolar-type H+-ATPase subunit K
MNRPPPYFPQNQLSPPDENRYRKFKLVVAGIAVGAVAVIAAIGVAIYYLVRWIIG